MWRVSAKGVNPALRAWLAGSDAVVSFEVVADHHTVADINPRPATERGSPTPVKSGVCGVATERGDGARVGRESPVSQVNPNLSLARRFRCIHARIWFIQSGQNLSIGLADKAI